MLFKRGAFLTLGMTFLSILILALGSAILKNAEDSEGRVYELASMNRLLHLERSLQRAYAEAFLGTFNMSIAQNQTQHTFSLDLPSGSSTLIDSRFRFFESSHNLSELLISNMYLNFKFNSTQTLAEGYYQSKFTNSTGLFSPELNISYVYAHVKEPGAAYSLPVGTPANTHSIILYTSLQPNPIQRYLIQLYSSSADGNVSWNTHTPGAVNITVEYYGPNGKSVDSKLSAFTPLAGPLGVATQNVTINMSGSTPWPLVSVSTERNPPNPFLNYGQIFIAPYTYNFTAVITLFYVTPLARNATWYSYDKFNLSSSDLRLGKAQFYRLL